MIVSHTSSVNMSDSDGLNLSNAESALAALPCSHCATIVPDRSKVDDGDIRTKYERIDIYPKFPGLQSSAEAGCRLCRLLQQCLSTQASRDIEQGNTPPIDLPDSSQCPTWNLDVKIDIQFSFIPFTPVSWDSRFSLEGSPPQYNGVVNMMFIHYKPVAGPLKRKDGSEWVARLEFGIYDSPGALII